MTDLVTFGETMLRLSPPDDERVETADRYDVAVAGAESNVAVAAQRLGLDAAWTSKLPRKPPARKVTGTLRNHGVTVDVAWTDEGRLGTYYLETGEPPRGNDVVYDRAAAAVRTAEPAELPTDRIESARAFHTSGITPALSPTLADTTADLLAAAGEADTTTSFDVNYRSKLWSPTEAREQLEALFPAVDVLVVAHRDAREVLGREGDAEAVARALDADFDFEAVVVTRGADGALARSGERVVEQPTFEATDAYPIGTGDAFVGGFLATYCEDRDVASALEYGAATAAVKRSIPGDLAVVTPEDVEAVLAGDRAAISR